MTSSSLTTNWRPCLQHRKAISREGKVYVTRTLQNVASSLLDPQLQQFWRIQHTPVDSFEDSEQHRAQVRVEKELPQLPQLLPVFIIFAGRKRRCFIDNATFLRNGIISASSFLRKRLLYNGIPPLELDSNEEKTEEAEKV
ncbi:hypothetical protein HAX54_024373 [Datura stramonium]|uniref:Uncharacterized protein n=1 Tax=Datura stramonium TaxID=4076 RepID=A0ABS8UXW6_DATST|nr:hypothetical protein [Datura stramonium]